MRPSLRLPARLPIRLVLRIVVVTAGLVVAGAAFGALAGVLGLSALVMAFGDLPDTFVLRYAAFFGAIFGAVGTPPIAWLLLRRVPLGRAVAWCVVGAAVGGMAGMTMASLVQATLYPGGDGFWGVECALEGATAGFVGAAVALWRRRRLPDEALRVP